METKNSVIEEICWAIDIPVIKTTVGSSVPRKLFSDVLQYFGLPDNGSSIDAAELVVRKAQLEWKAEFDSRDSPSGGGGTITLDGLIALRDGINVLLDLEESIENVAGVFPISENEWTLFKGQKIRRQDLHNRYGGVRQGGISPSNKTKNVFVFSDDVSNQAHGYEFDHWIDSNTFAYCGEGQIGDQTLTRYNYSILNHVEDDKVIRLFEGSSGEVTYVGDFSLDIEEPYFVVKGKGRDGNLRNVIMFRLKRNLTTGSQENHQSFEENEIGVPYIFQKEEAVNYEQAVPFAQDPDAMDKALLQHKITQNMVATWLIDHGLEPLSPSKTDPQFDIAWISRGEMYVGEIKSINNENEIHQVRFAIGQVLDYCAELDAKPVIILSESPSISRLIGVVESNGIKFLWPKVLGNTDPRRL